MSDRQVAMVTAAAGTGIGATIARRLGADGMDVVITDIHERRAGELTAALAEEHGRPFPSLAVDVTDYDGVGDAVGQIVSDHGDSTFS